MDSNEIREILAVRLKTTAEERMLLYYTCQGETKDELASRLRDAQISTVYNRLNVVYGKLEAFGIEIREERPSRKKIVPDEVCAELAYLAEDPFGIPKFDPWPPTWYTQGLDKDEPDEELEEVDAEPVPDEPPQAPGGQEEPGVDEDAEGISTDPGTIDGEWEPAEDNGTSEPPPPPQDPIAMPTPEPDRRRNAIITAIAVILFLIVVILAGALWRATRGDGIEPSLSPAEQALTAEARAQAIAAETIASFPSDTPPPTADVEATAAAIVSATSAALAAQAPTPEPTPDVNATAAAMVSATAAAMTATAEALLAQNPPPTNTPTPTDTPTPAPTPWSEIHVTFDEPLGPEWGGDTTEWSVSGGELVSLSKDLWLSIGDDSWSDYAIEIAMVNIPVPGQCYFSIRDSGEDRLTLKIHHNAYGSWFSWLRANGEEIPNFDIPLGHFPYTLRIEAVGDTIRTIVDASEDDFTFPMTRSGRFLINCTREGTTFGDFRFTPLGS